MLIAKIKSPINHVRYSLSLKISLSILLFVIVIFVVSIGFLFNQSHKMIRNEAIGRNMHALNNSVLRVRGFLNEAETATNNIEWIVKANIHPDSLLQYSRNVVALNPHIDGCSISMEPYFFNEKGRYFSVYTIRKNDSILSVVEKEYEYFERDWYKTSLIAGRPTWVNPFTEEQEDYVNIGEYITSYCKPIINEDGKSIGVISTDITISRLLDALTEEKPYPQSYIVWIDDNSRYIAHPDFSKLNRPIYDGIDPSKNPSIYALGHEMQNQNTGMLQVEIDGKSCMVFYMPIEGTNWSAAFICPEEDVFRSYNHLLYIIIPLLTFGFFILLVFCFKSVSHFINPLKQLAWQARQISKGEFDKRMPRSSRPDIVGRLQNSFAKMQQSLSTSVANIQKVSEQTEQRNKELTEANQLVKESDHKKAAFIQDMSHQIRTPLNIINGFAQVMRDEFHLLPTEEIAAITTTMSENLFLLNRMINMLIAASYLEGHSTLEQIDDVECNQIAREVASNFEDNPAFELHLESSIEGNLFIRTNRLHLFKILYELLYNAKRFASGKPVFIKLSANANDVYFIIEDHGPGINEAHQPAIFTLFGKINEFTEGLGLGLPICKQFAKLLGGDLNLDTTYKNGARFILRIPNE